MEITLKQVVEAAPALQDISTKELPVKTSFKIAKNLEMFRAESQIFDDERVKLLKELGEPNEKIPGSYNLKDENRGAYQEKIEELLGCTIDIAVRKITLKEFESSGVKFKPSTLYQLGFMIDEEDAT